MTDDNRLKDNTAPKPIPNDFRTLAITRAAYEAARGWDAANGDTSAKSWEKADKDTREQTVRDVDFHLTNQLAGPGSRHRRWVDQQTAAGWEFGKAFSEADKIDPRLVPFHILPNTEQVRDRIFVAVIKAGSQV